MSERIRNFEQYLQVYNNSVTDHEGFWASVANDYEWMQPFGKVLEWNFEEPDIRWFLDGKLNITQNCLDRHVARNPEAIALIWEPNNPMQAALTYTYQELLDEVCRCANVLKSIGVQKGDRVCLYLPMVPELAIAVLACARIGAIHSVIFAGFSAGSIADRIADSGAEFIITADAMSRGAKQIPLKAVVDEALEHCHGVRKVVVFNKLNWPLHMLFERDVWFHDAVDAAGTYCPPEPMDAQDPLFILYTSGSTGKPKGVVHACGGYMVYAGYTFANVFQYEPGEVFWCTADIGWITGHSYLLYGALLNGATSLMFEGIPTYPDPGRFWQIVDKHAVNILYTAPTAIRSLMAAGLDHVLPYSLHSLKKLGSVGEPINEEAWHWYHTHIGKGRCPVVDTWWQTETGGIMISALAGVSPLTPAHAGLPLPGIQPVLLDGTGKEIEGNGVEGYLAVQFPWPGMLRTTWGDHQRCRLNYFDTYKGYYFTGDGAKRAEDGNYRIIGRVDDVINVSGHRFGTAEIENAINQNPGVVESAVVGFPHDIKGQGIYAFVIPEAMPENHALLRDEIIETVAAAIGRIARPDKIQIVAGLPKTRSGKIMRRILRKIAEREYTGLGDTSTLLDPLVVDEIIRGAL